MAKKLARATALRKRPDASARPRHASPALALRDSGRPPEPESGFRDDPLTVRVTHPNAHMTLRG